MGGRMPVNFECLRIAIGQEAKLGVFLERTGKVDEIAISFGHQRGIGQTLANRFGDLERGRSLGDIFHGPVRKPNLNAVCHRFPEQCKESSVYWRVRSGSNYPHVAVNVHWALFKKGASPVNENVANLCGWCSGGHS